ncbi:MAG TPA: formimidoylglutamate deiminase [Anaeromyxobacter sp.]|nr:formimidoylglutamate deiminase [Anaeromyxobacter sp.]
MIPRYPFPVPGLAFLPDLLLADGALRAGAALSVRDGKVVAAGAPAAGFQKVPLRGRILLPGFVSAHGHAFQRALRGRAERRRQDGSTFWSWRESMYAVAERLGPDGLEAVARLAFLELARAGVTCVGEFHYLHRDPAGRPYANPSELALRVVRAARSVGLRIALLRAGYGRAGAGGPPAAAQRRFVEESPDAYLAGLAHLAGAVEGDPLVSLGVAPHSVRACPPEWLCALAAEADRRALPLHVHAAEQPAEVAACRAEHGTSPVGLLARAGALGPRTTLVHAIHLDDADVDAIGAARATVCACPLTERNLGDGIVPADRLAAAGARLALGVDAHVEADPLGEARALELHLRLARGTRAVLDEPPGGLAPALLEALTAGGMASLGLSGGRLAPGDPADFVLLDTDDPSLAGASGESLLAAILLGASPAAVKSTFVAGEPILEDGWPAPGRPAGAEILERYRRAVVDLWGAA